jgi:CRP-like cAMP-binding protein
MFLPVDQILGGCAACCPCHTQLRRNLLQEASEKFWALRQRLNYLSEPSLRARILLFLRDEQKKAGTALFTIPYNREKLAEFLAVNRSALSRELSRLQEDGVIEYYRNSFRLL